MSESTALIKSWFKVDETTSTCFSFSILLRDEPRKNPRVLEVEIRVSR